MKKVLSLAVVLTLLCFPVTGFCSIGAVFGAAQGAATASVVAIGVGTVVGGVVGSITGAGGGLAVVFGNALNAVLSHILGIAVAGGAAGAFEEARGEHPILAGGYVGAGVGVALGAF